MFIRFQRSFLSTFLFCFVSAAAASASPLGAGRVCGKSIAIPLTESGQPGCARLFPEPSEDEGGEGESLVESARGSVEFVRFLAPFSWNFAAAFERLPVTLHDSLAPVSPYKSGRLERVRGEDAYCNGGCSTALSAVPEPATMVLLGGALTLLSGFIRNRANSG